MKSQTILLLATASLLFGCSNKGSNNNNDQVATTGAYNYTYSADQGEPSCTTNMHNPGSMQEYCEMLRDDASNNNCARDQRYENFRTTCPSYTWNNQTPNMQQHRPEATHPQYRGQEGNGGDRR